MTESKEPDSDEPDAPTGSASGAKAKEDAVWSAIQEAWAAARNHSSEIGRLAADHVSVQADRVRLRIRRAAIRAAIALLLAMTLVVALAAAAVHAISGLTGGLGALFGVDQ